MVSCTCTGGIAYHMPDGNHIYCELCEQGKTLSAKAEESMVPDGVNKNGDKFDWNSILPSGATSTAIYGSGVAPVSKQPTGVMIVTREPDMLPTFKNNSSDRLRIQVTSPGNYMVYTDTYSIPYQCELGDELILDPGHWYEKQ